MQCADAAMATPGDLEAAYADAVRGERGGVHLLRLCQKTGPVWGQLSTHTCQALLEVFIKHVRVRLTKPAVEEVSWVMLFGMRMRSTIQS